MAASTEPFGLPRGTVRGAITLLLLTTLAATLFVPLTSGAGGVRDGLLALAVMAVKDYFSVRGAQNVQDGPVLPPPSVG